MPPSRVETIDPRTLHLSGEFAEQNLGEWQGMNRTAFLAARRDGVHYGATYFKDGSGGTSANRRFAETFALSGFDGVAHAGVVLGAQQHRVAGRREAVQWCRARPGRAARSRCS